MNYHYFSKMTSREVTRWIQDHELGRLFTLTTPRVIIDQNLTGFVFTNNLVPEGMIPRGDIIMIRSMADMLDGGV